MLKSDNPVKDAMRHDAEVDAYEDSLPTCDMCGEPMYDWFIEFGKEKICPDCVEKLTVYVESYLERSKL